ncbi:MAG: DUF4167 domain-containing protein [Alphaproteobacteria bacterium]|nr:DUF4167 domain-containing protein [Alphaproteobacteria bacterium]
MRHSNGKRSRGRSGRRPSPQQNINRAYDSNGPAGKLRGTAAQLVEKYVALARDARVGRDRVLVENFLQHAEHYQRILNEIMIAQGIEPEGSDDDDAGDDLDNFGSGRQNNGGSGHAPVNGGSGGNGGGKPQAQQSDSQQQQEPQRRAAQSQVAGGDDQPDIADDVTVEVPVAASTPTPRATRTRRPRRTAAQREEAKAEQDAGKEPAGTESE